MNCSKCGFQNPPDAQTCQNCNADLSKDIAKDSGGQDRTDLSPAVVSPDVTSDEIVPAQDGTSMSDTTPLPSLRDAFAPLPEGALLCEGRYAIRETRDANEEFNVYVVDDMTPARRCPNCDAILYDFDEQFCATCGADLSNVQPVHLRYLVKEGLDLQGFALESWLIGQALQHPGLDLPVDIFTESPYGPERQYRVTPEFSLSSAVDLSVPQDLNTVLEWGVKLSQALAHLHQYQVVFREVGLSHIIVEGQASLWTNLHQATLIPPKSRGTRARLFAQNVRGLTVALLYLATGERDLAEVASLPEAVTELFDQALDVPPGLSAKAFATQLETVLEDLRRPESVTLVVGRRTDVGQLRSLNEDSVLTLDMAPVYRSISQPLGIFVVADGMGGHEAGDIASQAVVDKINQMAISQIFTQAAAQHPLPDIEAWLTEVTLAANEVVYKQSKSEQNNMGTTLVMALLIGDEATIVNVGDSRCYHLDTSGIQQITTDHSLVERMVATGQITREEAAHHPQKNVIYRVMGDKQKLPVDLFEQSLAIGDALLLCSDGLSGMVSDSQIWEIWRASVSPQDACDRLVEAANLAGGEDNISVLIVQVTH